MVIASVRIPESSKRRVVELIGRTPLDGALRNAYKRVRPLTEAIDLRDFSTSFVKISAVDDLLLAAGWIVGVSGPPPTGFFELRTDSGTANQFPISNWFTGEGQAVDDSPYFFQLTVDHRTRGEAVEGRVVVPDVFTSDWTTLPSTELMGLVASEIILSCNSCGNDDSSSVGIRHGLMMRRCDQCGLVFTAPRPKREHVLARYDERYFTQEYLESQRETPELVGHWENLLSRVQPYFFEGASLFEIGFGAGGMLRRAQARGWAVSGSDVNEAAVDFAKLRGLDVRLENIDDVDELAGTYDCIISEMSLEHLSDPHRAIELSAEALAPGGCLLLYTVSAEGKSFREEGMASYLVGPGEHLYLFSSESLCRMVADAGLALQSLWVDNQGNDVGVVAVKSRAIG